MTSVKGTLLLLAFLLNFAGGTSTKFKRQIYREQVLPSSGGKIPEGAFRADRLALNRLNKEGIAVPDGVLLEHRQVHSHPHSIKHDPEDEDSIVKIYQTPDNRYTPPEGTYHNEQPLTVSSTYLIRKPIGRDEVNIRTPDQQTPHHQLLAQRYNTHYQQQYRPHYQTPSPALYNHHPQPYYPISYPFELPNKDSREEHFFDGDLSDDVDWQYLLNRYTQLSEEIDNGLLPQDSYRYSVPQSLYLTPDVLPGYNYFYSGHRFARKSQEGTAADKKASLSSKRLLSSRCVSRVEQSSKCQILHQLCQKNSKMCQSARKCTELPPRVCIDHLSSRQPEDRLT